MKSEQKNTPTLVSAVVREFQADAGDTKISKKVKLLDMAVNQRTLKRSRASALVDKNYNISKLKKGLERHWIGGLN